MKKYVVLVAILLFLVGCNVETNVPSEDVANNPSRGIIATIELSIDDTLETVSVAPKTQRLIGTDDIDHTVDRVRFSRRITDPEQCPDTGDTLRIVTLNITLDYTTA